MELINFLRVLVRRKWLILAISSVAMVTTFLIARKAPEVYKVYGRLSAGIIGGNDAYFSPVNVQGPQKYEIEAHFKNLEEMVRSPRVLELVSYRLMLHDLERKEPFRDLSVLKRAYSSEELRVARRRFKLKRDSIQSLVSTDELERKHLDMVQKMAYDPPALREGLEVQRIPGTDLIGIEYQAQDPYFAAFVVNTLGQEFIRYHAHHQAARSKSAIDFFETMVAEKKSELDEKMKLWERYQQDQGITNVVDPAQGVLNRIELLEREREEANQAVFAAERRLIDLQRELSEGNRPDYQTEVVSRNTSQAVMLRQRLNRLNEQFVQAGLEQPTLLDSLVSTRDELSQTLFDAVVAGHPEMPTPDRQLVQEQIDNELRLEVARSRIRAIDQELRKLGGRAGSFTAAQGGTPSAYGKQVEVARDAYLLALNKYNEARLAATEDMIPGTITQVDLVQAPEQPEPSRTLLLVILAGLMSLALCVVVIFALEYLDNSIRYPSRFTALTGLKPLGLLNRMTTTNLDLVTLFEQTHKNSSLENYKQLLRKIRHEVMAVGPKTLLITSTRDGVGKTSLMVSLAYSLSLNQKKVLLVDTNFKQPSLTEITAASPALERYLSGQLPRKALISNSVFKGVDVIGCEGSTRSPAEIFSEEAFENLLIDLSREYDHILMEGPPLNQYADSRELVRYAAKVLPVFSAEYELTPTDMDSLSYLKSLSSQAMDPVLNKVELANLNQ